jgi:uncharacterized membrane protein
MTYIYLGVLLFGGSHLFSIFFPAARDGFEERLGAKAWKSLYALVSLAGLACLILGYWQSRSAPVTDELVYDPPLWGRHVTMLLVLLAFILIGAAHGKGYIKSYVHNPMSLGVSLWAAGHLLANGQRSDVFLFGVFLVVGLADIVMSEVRGKRPDYQPRLRSDIIAVIVGMVLYVIFLFGFHPYVLKIPVAG